MGKLVVEDSGQEKTSCPYCGQDFKKNRFWQKFCSSDCTNRYHLERNKQARRLMSRLESKLGGTPDDQNSHEDD